MIKEINFFNACDGEYSHTLNVKDMTEFSENAPVDISSYTMKINGDVVTQESIQELFGGGGMKFDADKTKFTLVQTDSFQILHGGSLEMEDVENKSTDDLFTRFIELVACFQLDDRDGVDECLYEIFHYVTQGRPEGDIFEQVAKVYTFGAKKYSADSWKKVTPDRYVNAIGRHILYGYLAEDDDSGMDHWVHIVWNCIAVHYLLNDDRPGYALVESEIPKKRH